MRRRKEDKRKQEEKQRREEEKRRAQEAIRKAEEERLRKEKERLEAEEKRRMREERRKTEFGLLGDSWAENPDTAESEKENKSIEKLENYKYFKAAQIKHSMTIPQASYKKAEQLYQQGNIKMKQVISGYDGINRGIRGQIDAVGKSADREFPVRIIFSRTEVTHTDCRCPDCVRDYYNWNYKETKCPYKAGVLNLLEEYLNSHSLGMLRMPMEESL